VDPATFDGATLRLTRRGVGGLQLVLWTLQDHRWQRWASAPMTHVAELQEAWLRSQQWGAISPNALAVLDDVQTFQVYSYCASGWGNFQSSCGTSQTVDGSIQGGQNESTGGNINTNASATNGGANPSAAPSNSVAAGGGGTSTGANANGSGGAGSLASGGGNGNEATNGSVVVNNVVTFPTGIRIQLGLKEGALSRERELPTL